MTFREWLKKDMPLIAGGLGGPDMVDGMELAWDAAVMAAWYRIGELEGGEPARDNALADAMGAVRALKTHIERMHAGADMPCPKCGNYTNGVTVRCTCIAAEGEK